MPVDMSQFLQTFYEESFEGLDVMEKELLQLDISNSDPETINTIFRAAHSIKGGSGTFGLTAVADYTHIMETLLDEMRDGRRTVSETEINALLKAVDVLRAMLTAIQAGAAPDTQAVAASRQQLEAILAGSGDSGGECDDARNESGRSAPAAAAPPANQGGVWEIVFRPFPGMLQSGNDPVRMLRELAGLGEYQVEADLSQLPDFEHLAPEDACLGWTIRLQGDIDEAAIREVFEWVDGDCELAIKHVAAGPDRVSPAPAAAMPQQVVTPQAGEGAARQAPAPQAARDAAAPRVAESSSIRVAIDKIDDLINMMGELVITQSMLSQLGEADEFSASHVEKLRDGLAQLERNTRELQENVMRIRMLPISFAFQRFPRLVHDLSNKLGKQIELRLSGEQTELDKTVMEKIGDPLVHLVRNSLDHGIETPDRRRAAGKPETGEIHLNAFHEGGNIVIEISDDGAGLDRERILAKAIENGLVGADDNLDALQIDHLIFEPGFSTAEVVSDVSGRGVGMDVVRKNIRALGGTIEVHNQPGTGSRFTVRLPLTLAILDGQSVQVGQEIYIVPLISIIESLVIVPQQVKSVAGAGRVYRLREEYIPIVNLAEVFGVAAAGHDRLEEGLLVVVESEGRKIALQVDDLLGQQQVVIKSLETNFRQVAGLSGATILGDGTVALILDISGLINLSRAEPGPESGNRSSQAA